MAGGIEARHLAALGRLHELVGVQEGLDAGRHRARVGVVDLPSRKLVLLSYGYLNRSMLASAGLRNKPTQNRKS